MSETKTCPHIVWRGGIYSGGQVACGKPVKRNGLCGVHARQREQAELRSEKDEAAKRDRAEAAALAQALTERLGVTVVSGGWPDPYLWISLEDARKLATP